MPTRVTNLQGPHYKTYSEKEYKKLQEKFDDYVIENIAVNQDLRYQNNKLLEDVKQLKKIIYGQSEHISYLDCDNKYLRDVIKNLENLRDVNKNLED